jgi:H+/gluconate symporter-like permease
MTVQQTLATWTALETIIGVTGLLLTLALSALI